MSHIPFPANPTSRKVQVDGASLSSILPASNDYLYKVLYLGFHVFHLGFYGFHLGSHIFQFFPSVTASRLTFIVELLGDFFPLQLWRLLFPRVRLRLTRHLLYVYLELSCLLSNTFRTLTESWSSAKAAKPPSSRMLSRSTGIRAIDADELRLCLPACPWNWFMACNVLSPRTSKFST